MTTKKKPSVIDVTPQVESPLLEPGGGIVSTLLPEPLPEPSEDEILHADSLLTGTPPKVITKPHPVVVGRERQFDKEPKSYPNTPTAPYIGFSMKNEQGAWYLRKVFDPNDPLLEAIRRRGWTVSFHIPGRCNIRMNIKRACVKLREGKL